MQSQAEQSFTPLRIPAVHRKTGLQGSMEVRHSFVAFLHWKCCSDQTWRCLPLSRCAILAILLLALGLTILLLALRHAPWRFGLATLLACRSQRATVSRCV